MKRDATVGIGDIPERREPEPEYIEGAERQPDRDRSGYDERDEQIWGEVPPRDGVDEWARESDPFYATQPPADSERLITEVEYQRLLAAENVAVMYGWCPVREGTDRERVAHDLWKKWHDLAGATFAGPRAHPDLVALEEEEAAGG